MFLIYVKKDLVVDDPLRVNSVAVDFSRIEEVKKSIAREDEAAQFPFMRERQFVAA